MSGRLATAILGGGVLAHTFLIGMQTMHVGHAPLVGTTAALSAFVWLLGLSYLYIELTTDERAMGVFVAPLIVVLDLIPALDPVASPRPPLLQSPLFTLHIVSMLFAYASFALACVLGVTYVLLFNEIKAKHLGFFYARLPSLQVLDAMNARVVSIGWLFLTLGIAVGGLWATQIQSSSDPRAQAMSIEDPKILVAIICWVVYSFALVARRADRLERTARGVALGAGVRDRAVELRADRLFPDEESQFLESDAPSRSWPQPSHGARGVARIRRLRTGGPRRGAPRARRARRQPRDGRALDVQPRRDLRRRRLRRGRRRHLALLLRLPRPRPRAR